MKGWNRLFEPEIMVRTCYQKSEWHVSRRLLCTMKESKWAFQNKVEYHGAWNWTGKAKHKSMCFGHRIQTLLRGFVVQHVGLGTLQPHFSCHRCRLARLLWHWFHFGQHMTPWAWNTLTAKAKHCAFEQSQWHCEGRLPIGRYVYYKYITALDVVKYDSALFGLNSICRYSHQRRNVEA